ncbi:tRNA (adenosine(37)-N6)-threonylcarbamoyltransferase complex dimerization subunit type 1 TsaB [Bittarella massiliensis (ex Durand et al. 2017)]|uniref:tRNA (adenosine(37)-N6)-threonylcarbamoyltransferase complex dimerization subunit type 1 TsaB n=1 Tax=Bittarella massiliensis (ex Durand et al. 2017) TaxID=1720313 RepID=UPI001AA1938F|nr:tRNA (adenosine(37)-N6)-threonylcarbamoyltransferase complex dimerization subunit type 1 TsaB [Bittarella massiliensis (ex Durand et al. 2017)]MBO1678576.1 tRNA (adenosine(37)-N6)-threonylcarbamoyltransferase complex dimerization subunit type 1 TsaB [Bittarella massiliensis (ex Durand et al. 2017)]
MRILGLDCSAKSASCAVVEEGIILAESFVNTKLTHSETLLPMIDGMLQAAKIDLHSVDLLAVTHGPGSFTGLRIGAAAIKGLCAGAGLPCVGISTLEATAYNLAHERGYLVPCMDARRNQVYTATFLADGSGAIKRVSEDEAVAAEEALRFCSDEKMPIFLLGDGGRMCYTIYNGNARVRLAPPHLLSTRGSAVAACAAAPENRLRAGDGAALALHYIRLSQAQRERQERQRLNGGM